MRHSNDEDSPPYSRLFVIGVKNISKDDITKVFSQCGEVESVWKLYRRDYESSTRSSHEDQLRDDKGMCYVKFYKTCSAALAVQQLTGTRISEDQPRGLKVVVASTKAGNQKEDIPQDLITKVFLQVPKTATEDSIEKQLGSFGTITRVKVVRNRETKEPRGFAYVWFSTFLEAANCVEGASKELRAIFAKPVDSPAGPNKRPPPGGADGGGYGDSYYGGRGSMPLQPGYSQGPPPTQGGYGWGAPSGRREPKMGRYDEPQLPLGGAPGGPVSPAMGMYEGYPHSGHLRLTAYIQAHVTQEQAAKLFDLVPGMEYCDLQGQDMYNSGSAMVTVKYSRPECAAYAKDKLDGFEYPPGFRLKVGYSDEARQQQLGSSASTAIHTLTETLKKATDALREAGLGQTVDVDIQGLTQIAGRLRDEVKRQDGPMSDLQRVPHCSAFLPPVQPNLDPNTKAAARLFTVFLGQPPPVYHVRDIFCRFGQFIDFRIINGKSFGYAMYGSEDCAKAAMERLHMQDFCGVRTKVIWAEDRPVKGEQHN